MFVQIILGALAGTLAAAGLGIWYSKRKQNTDGSEAQKSIDRNSLDNKPLSLDLPLEKKLRDALYEAERSEEKCWREAMELYQSQKDLLQSIGKASYVALSHKDLFFELTQPKTKEKLYYYQRDLKNDRSEDFFKESKLLLEGYQEHIEILYSKIELFQKLQVSHKEQLAKIDGIQQQHEHWQKLQEHREKLDALSKNTDIELQSLRHETLMEEIERELDFQQECLKQYQDLYEDLGEKLDKNTVGNIKINIQNIIDQIDSEEERK
jgi:hypothetical protein